MRVLIKQLIRFGLSVWILATVNAWSTEIDSELVKAAEKGNVALVKQILDAKTVERENLNAAFWAAIKKGNPAIVERFLQAGANINLRAENGFTPLMQAARDGWDQVVEMLLEAQADVNAVSEKQDTAPILAAEKDRRKVIPLLLAAHATCRGN